MDQKSQIKRFEAALDRALLERKCFSYDANATLALAANIYETAGLSSMNRAEALERGISILAPHLVSGKEGTEPSIDILVEDMLFASHYYMLREYLYYSYNVPGALSWKFGDNRIDIKFSDPSIPRQFFTVHNDVVLLSRENLGTAAGVEEARHLLVGEIEKVTTPNVEAAFELIQQEAKRKLETYFSVLARDSDIALGDYSYRQFVEVYERLLCKSLYHRHMSQTNGFVGAIFIEEEEIIDALKEELGYPRVLIAAILKDVVFDNDAIRDRCDASYFSMYREGAPSNRIVLRPHHFCISEGLVNLLRVVAQRRPNTFLKEVSNQLGGAFVQRVKRAFAAEGFICHSEVSTRSFDPALPDVDLVVISEEPTLGYVMLVCEVKSPLPPRWAKDQLKVLNRDSISKAFRQVDAIRKFLRTEDGVKFLTSLLPGKGHPFFKEFVIAVEPLIITSDNAGMFFGREDCRIINFRTLERLLARSDGDMAYVQYMLRTYNEIADQCVRKVAADVQVGKQLVSYEGVTECPILKFPQNTWRSSSDRQQMIDEFVATGFHPFDAFGSDSR